MPRAHLRARFAALVALCVALSALSPASAEAVQSLGLSTGSFEFSVAAGDTGSGDMVVMNEGDEPITVLVYTANQIVDEEGKVTYEIPNRNLPNFGMDPASWFSISAEASTRSMGNTPVLDMEPGERLPVSFTFSVPNSIAAGDHQILLFFELLQEDQAGEGASAQVSGRVGARIRVRVQGEIVERMDIRPFSIKGLILGDELPYTYVVLNEGNVDKAVSVRMALLDGNENEVWASEVATETTIYANTSLERSGVLEPSTKFGKYTARITLEYPREGDGTGGTVTDVVVKDRTVWIVPLWAAITVVVVVALVLMYLSWRRAVKVAERRNLENRRLRAERRAEMARNLEEAEEPAE